MKVDCDEGQVSLVLQGEAFAVTTELCTLTIDGEFHELPIVKFNFSCQMEGSPAIIEGYFPLNELMKNSMEFALKHNLLGATVIND